MSDKNKDDWKIELNKNGFFKLKHVMRTKNSYAIDDISNNDLEKRGVSLLIANVYPLVNIGILNSPDQV